MSDEHPFNQTVSTTNQWLAEIAEAAGVTGEFRAYQALRVTLHALRDRLPIDEMAHIGAQLPMLMRGLYYEGWRPADNLGMPHSPVDFVDSVRDELDGMSRDEAVTAARGVFAVIGARISSREVDDIRGKLPMPIRELWPRPVGAHAA